MKQKPFKVGDRVWATFTDPYGMPHIKKGVIVDTEKGINLMGYWVGTTTFRDVFSEYELSRTPPRKVKKK